MSALRSDDSSLRNSQPFAFTRSYSFPTTLLLQLTTLLTYHLLQNQPPWHSNPLHQLTYDFLSFESFATKMQRKDLEEQLEMLKTAIQEKQPSANVISILKRLQVEVVPTEEILRVRSLCC